MKIPKVVKNTTFYSLASFLQKGIGFLLLPLYTHYLTPDDYGVLNVITSITGFISILFTMSLHGAASRFHFDSEELIYRAKVWGTILLLVIVNSIFWGVISITFHKYLVDPFIKGIDFYPLVLLAIIGTVMSPVYMFYQQWLRNRQDGVKYIINSLSNFALTVVLNIILLTIFNLGVMSMILSSLIVAIVYFAYSILRFIPNISFEFDKEIGKRAMSYSLPLIPHNITGYWSVMIDRIMLNTMLGSAAVGLYSIGSQFGSIISIVASSINLAFSPWCFQEMAKGKEGDYNKLYLFADAGSAFCGVAAMVISLYSPEVVALMTSSSAYSDAWQPIPFICFGFVANGLYYFFCQPLFFAHTKYVMYISFLALATAYWGNLFLIPLFGIIGTGLSLYLSMIVTALLALIMARRLEPQIKYHSLQMIGVSIMLLLLSMSVFLFQTIDNIIVRLAAKSVLLLAVFVVLCIVYKSGVSIIINRIKKK